LKVSNSQNAFLKIWLWPSFNKLFNPLSHLRSSSSVGTSRLGVQSRYMHASRATTFRICSQSGGDIHKQYIQVHGHIDAYFSLVEDISIIEGGITTCNARPPLRVVLPLFDFFNGVAIKPADSEAPTSSVTMACSMRREQALT
jgi:hypothetical protein